MPELPTNKRTKRVDGLVGWIDGARKPYPSCEWGESRAPGAHLCLAEARAIVPEYMGGLKLCVHHARMMPRSVRIDWLKARIVAEGVTDDE